jgi:RecQ family ATP-dependent DNA helicase
MAGNTTNTASADPRKEAIKQLRVQLAGIREKLFGFKSWRPGQEEAILLALHNQDVLVNFGTGSGKSICYQLPALVCQSGITIVVSPLISLVRDQVSKLKAKGITAAFIDSHLNEDEIAEQYKIARSGKIRLLYVSPERLQSEKFYKAIAGIKINFLAVDEAHCASLWGDSFRPPYRALGKVRERLGHPPIIASTATASTIIKRDIYKYLDMNEPREVIGKFARENLKLGFIKTSTHEDKLTQIKQILSIKSPSAGRPTIIYCKRIKEAEALQIELGKIGLAPILYHGRMEGGIRADSQSSFMLDETPLMIATQAFGMGIDKDNIRQIIHYGLPARIEDYWQQIGRAGRDGENADCLLIWNFLDIYEIHQMTRGTYPSFKTVEASYKLLLHILKLNQDDQKKEGLSAIAINLTKLAEGYSDQNKPPNEMLQTWRKSSFAILQDLDLIKVDGTLVTFKYPEDARELKASRISPEDLKARYLKAMDQIKTMLSVALSPNDHMRLIEDYFFDRADPKNLHNDTFSENFSPDKERFLTIMKALFEKDYTLKELVEDSFQFGLSSEAGAACKESLRSSLAILSNLGFVKKITFTNRSYYSLSAKGEKLLLEQGLRVKPISNWEQFCSRMHSPAGLTVLGEALKSLYKKRDKSSTQELCAKKIELFGEEMSVLKLISVFRRQKSEVQRPFLEEALTRMFEITFEESKYLSKNKDGMTLTLLANWLSDNILKLN